MQFTSTKNVSAQSWCHTIENRPSALTMCCPHRSRTHLPCATSAAAPAPAATRCPPLPQQLHHSITKSYLNPMPRLQCLSTLGAGAMPTHLAPLWLPWTAATAARCLCGVLAAGAAAANALVVPQELWHCCAACWRRTALLKFVCSLVQPCRHRCQSLTPQVGRRACRSQTQHPVSGASASKMPGD